MRGRMANDFHLLCSVIYEECQVEADHTDTVVQPGACLVGGSSEAEHIIELQYSSIVFFV